jgi:DNA-binding SARP family transcriptional activator
LNLSGVRSYEFVERGGVPVWLLGTVEIVNVGGQVLPVRAAKRRAVLAMLAAELNRVVSVDALLDAVWDGEPPPRARTALQVHVSALRKFVGHGLRGSGN